MSSIFRKDDNVGEMPKRNVFDLSFQNNLTLRMGELVPVLCQEVLPGDSFKIDPSFGLRYMPQVFPVQTRQRASIKYYYVRNRNLWKDWPDFIGKNKTGLTPPYIKFKNDGSHFYYLRPSSMADYMGVPIKIDVPYNSTKTFKSINPAANQGQDYVYIPSSSVVYSNQPNEPFAVLYRYNMSRLALKYGSDTTTYALNAIYGGFTSSDILPPPTKFVPSLDLSYGYVPHFALFRKAWKLMSPAEYTITFNYTGSNHYKYVIVRCANGDDVALRANENDVVSIGTYAPIEYTTFSATDGNTPIVKKDYITNIVGIMADTEISVFSWDITLSPLLNPDLCWCDVDLTELPFANELDDTKLRLSALPFRAIQAAYNGQIRDPKNNPFILNGQPEYNKYISNDNGGADTDYHDILRTYAAPWSDDRFTTALPSPQQGNAPLVGLTGIQGATLMIGNDDGTQSSIRLQYDADTGNLTGVDAAASVASEDLISEAWNAVDYGISINDFRNINSYQRWKENNARGGYNYRDQISAHYGVSVRFDVLDMPEFIGGVSRDVSVNQITQTVENEYGNLGDYAGQSGVFGEGHSIEHYCDEHGFIIGLMSVYPMPLYQDTLPKYLTKNDAFDYFFPEFGKIGMQPITNKELAFSLSYVKDDMDGTFGYQRAYYDYLENLDQIHGLFRFDLRNYLIARDLIDVPQLGNNFLTISPDDVNNTFYSDDDNDKIIGQVYHKISAKRPIPLVGIPAIE